MPNNKLSTTIKDFRESVKKSGGPQISSMYEVILYHFKQQPLYCYPLSVVVPGRQFVFYEQDLWGPNRKVPYKRGYTQCHMSFIIYQDWEERAYIENWMNTIVQNDNLDGSDVDPNLSTGRDAGIGDNALGALNAFAQQFASSTAFSQDAQFDTNYQDYVNYRDGVGLIQIGFLNSNTKAYNGAIILKEAYPAAISQMGIGADGTGYSTFNVTFQFNDYFYYNNSLDVIGGPQSTSSLSKTESPSQPASSQPGPITRGE